MRTIAALVAVGLAAGPAAAQQAPATSGPADGYTIHVTAPHMYQGREIGPVHHFCKPITDDPLIVCLLYDTMEPNAPLHGIEYIIAKSLTRPTVSRGTWNANFHDHRVEIATGRVRVLDVPAEKAKEIADLVATTDGIIFHLWPQDDTFPTGTVSIDQSVGHRPMTEGDFARSAQRPQNR